MIKTILAHTSEPDDEKIALTEIMYRLAREELCKYSLGIIACHIDFIKNGILKKLVEGLAFDTIGINTLAAALPGSSEQPKLVLMVLTSDDVEISVVLSEPLRHKEQTSYDELYSRLREKTTLPARSLFLFAPLLYDVTGDEIVERLDKATGNLPCYGALPIYLQPHIREPVVLFNGEVYHNRIAAALLAGEVSPNFSATSVAQNKIRKRSGVITKSAANVLIEVDHIPVMQFFDMLGYVKNGRMIDTTTVPLIVDFGDGSPAVVRTILDESEKSFFVMGGQMPVGAKIYIGAIDALDVVESAKESLCNAFAAARPAVFFSCAARNLALGANNMAELDLAAKLGNKGNFIYAYVGGEICPVEGKNGALVNRFHNFTLTSCLF